MKNFITSIIIYLFGKVNKSTLITLMIKNNSNYELERFAKDILRASGFHVDGGALWHKDDIIESANQQDEELTPEEIDEVLNRMEKVGCDVGINWDVINQLVSDIVYEREEKTVIE